MLEKINALMESEDIQKLLTENEQLLTVRVIVLFEENGPEPTAPMYLALIPAPLR